MAKKEVSKITFTVCTSLYHALCIAGLIWQVVQISTNYFKFEVVSDIKIILPESDKGNKFLNICFQNNEVLNDTVYEKIKSEYEKTFDDLNKMGSDEESIKSIVIDNNFTIGQHFEIGISDEKLFIHKNRINITIFVTKRMICYQIKDTIYDPVYAINQTHLSSVTYAHFSASSEYPNIDLFRLQPVTEINDLGRSKIIIFKPVSYFIDKLSWPFIDNCINFSQLGYRDKHHAIVSCLNEREIARNHDRAFRGMLFTQNDRNMMDKRLSILTNDSELGSDCEKYLSKVDDCHREIIFSNLKLDDTPSAFNMTGVIGLVRLKGNSPSYGITSKPRIDHIDYVTYIFGSLGSWIGFSFLLINPIPYLITVKDENLTPNQSLSNQRHTCASFRNTVNSHHRKLIRLGLLVSKLIDGMERQSRKIDRVTKFDGRLKRIELLVSQLME